MLLSGLAVLMLVACATPIAWARWVLRGTTRSRTVATVLSAGLLIMIAGSPLWAATALYALIAIATFGCGPDANECPF